MFLEYIQGHTFRIVIWIVTYLQGHMFELWHDLTEQIVMDEYKPSGEIDLLSEDEHASLGHYIKF